MTIISDGTLFELVATGELEIEPFIEQMIQPASIDVTASGLFRVFRNSSTVCIDPRRNQPDLTEETSQEGERPFVLHPGEFVLGSTVERFKLPFHVVGRLEGKSSLGRLGLVIHSTAGFIDPGFDGTITLELSNASTMPILLWSGMPIGQVSFQFLDKPCLVPYGDPRRKSKYQGQRLPTASKMHENWDKGPTLTAEEIAEERVAMGTPNVLPPVGHPLGEPPGHPLDMPVEARQCICVYIGNGERVPSAACEVHKGE